MAFQKAPNPIDRHVGSRIRMRRIMLDLSQTELGDELGITFQQIQKYEKGTNRVSASRLQHIATVLNVPVAFFFEGTNNQAAKAHGLEVVNDFLASTDGLALVKAFTGIKDPRLRRRIVDLVRGISGE